MYTVADRGVAVINMDCLCLALRLTVADRKRVAVLNMACRTKPGGGVRWGSGGPSLLHALHDKSCHHL